MLRKSKQSWCGPTSVEFAAELYDFLKKDVAQWYPDLSGKAQVIICEASGSILGSFHHTLVDYVDKLFKSRNIRVMTSVAVEKVENNIAELANGENIPFGLMVWSTGVKQTKLIREISKEIVAKFDITDRLQIDSYLRVLGTSNADDTLKLVGNANVFALGDCAGNYEKPLPALAQVASQQGKYIAKLLNDNGIETVSRIDTTSNKDLPQFKYAHLGSMAQVGQWKGVYDATQIGQYGPPVKGFLAFLLWRAAYWTKQVSVQNKVLILMYWFKSFVFGRDISRF